MPKYLANVLTPPIQILETPDEEYAVIIDLVLMKAYPMVARAASNGTWGCPWFSISAWGRITGFVNWLKETTTFNITSHIVDTLPGFWDDYLKAEKAAVMSWDVSLLTWLLSYGVEGYERLADYKVEGKSFKGQFFVVDGETLSLNGMLVDMGDFTDIAGWNVNGHGALAMPEATRLAYQKWVSWAAYYRKPFDFS